MDLVVVVTGGRDYTDRSAVFGVLDELRELHAVRVVMHGACPVAPGGADWIADDWTVARHVPCRAFPPDPRHGYRRFATRNHRMVEAANTLRVQSVRTPLVVAFPGGRGTAMTKGIATELGVPVWQPMLGEPMPRLVTP